MSSLSLSVAILLVKQFGVRVLSLPLFFSPDGETERLANDKVKSSDEEVETIFGDTMPNHSEIGIVLV